MERPSWYIADDYDLFKELDPYQHAQMSRREFMTLRSKLRSNGSSVVDIAASCNPFRGLVLFDSRNIVAVDPAYQWYDHETHWYQPDPQPFPGQVFGGTGSREELIRLLRCSLQYSSRPERFAGKKLAYLKGNRRGLQRVVELRSQDAAKWLEERQRGAVANYIVIRSFPSAYEWSRILATLKIGGCLVTSGYGRLNPKFTDSLKTNYHPHISQGGGVNIDGAALTEPGQEERLGLELVSSQGQLFYRKNRNRSQSEVYGYLCDRFGSPPRLEHILSRFRCYCSLLA